MRNRILPSSVLDLFQDAAGEHAASLGVGYYDLLPENKCWMILRLRYEMIAQPKMFSDVTVRTWPIESRRLEFDRDYIMYDRDGKELAKGTAQWAILDVSDREKPQFVTARSFDLGLDEYIPERALEGKFDRLAPNFEADGEPYITRSGYTDIDTNGHVNNIKYANFILDALDLPYDKVIRSFRIDYVKEVLDQSDIRISAKIDGDTVLCRGESGGNVCFAAKLGLK